MIVEILFILHVANGIHIIIQVYLHEFIVLKHINCIIDNYSSYEDNESIYNEYVELRKLIVEWIIECDKKHHLFNKIFLYK